MNWCKVMSSTQISIQSPSVPHQRHINQLYFILHLKNNSFYFILFMAFGNVGIGLEIWLPNGWRIGGRSTHADRHSYMALVAEGLPTHATTGLILSIPVLQLFLQVRWTWHVLQDFARLAILESTFKCILININNIFYIKKLFLYK